MQKYRLRDNLTTFYLFFCAIIFAIVSLSTCFSYEIIKFARISYANAV